MRRGPRAHPLPSVPHRGRTGRRSFGPAQRRSSQARGARAHSAVRSQVHVEGGERPRMRSARENSPNMPLQLHPGGREDQAAGQRRCQNLWEALGDEVGMANDALCPAAPPAGTTDPARCGRSTTLHRTLEGPSASIGALRRLGRHARQSAWRMGEPRQDSRGSRGHWATGRGWRGPGPGMYRRFPSADRPLASDAARAFVL